MQFHILVTPAPDEPLTVTAEQIDAGQAWLEERVADGRIDLAKAFPKTGGVMVVTVPADDETTALAQLNDFLVDYPLMPTIEIDINILLPTLKEGFDVLRAAHRERRRINA